MKSRIKDKPLSLSKTIKDKNWISGVLICAKGTRPIEDIGGLLPRMREGNGYDSIDL